MTPANGMPFPAFDGCWKMLSNAIHKASTRIPTAAADVSHLRVFRIARFID
jgi:hypothetical protein